MVTALTAGHINWDVTLRVDRLPEPDGEASIRSQFQSGGGSAANVAVALTALEVPTGLIGSIADDDNGLLARRELAAADVDLDGVLEVTGAETAVKYLLVDDNGEVSVLGTDGVNEAVRPTDIDPATIRDADHVHLTSQHPATAAYIASVATEASVPVSFDPGRRIGDRDYSETLAAADIIFATSGEAEEIVGHDSIAVDCTIVVTDGPNGATAYTGDSSIVHQGFDIDPVDTTGAGDAFAAGFLETVFRTDDISRALERGNACGALAARQQGPRGSPSLAELEQFLSQRK